MEEGRFKGLSIVPSVAYARRMESHGPTALSPRALKARPCGRTDDHGLGSSGLRRVKIPVIAAGGIAGGPQMLAAFALGAVGVQIGTALLLAEDARFISIIKMRSSGEGYRHDCNGKDRRHTRPHPEKQNGKRVCKARKRGCEPRRDGNLHPRLASQGGFRRGHP